MNTQTLEETKMAQALQPDKKEAFAQRMVGILNDSSLALMMSIGHQTGLFDTMAKLPP
ncbi:MAG: transcriptional regulator, partial [Candidatus Zixiibacteriota bacterium]